MTGTLLAAMESSIVTTAMPTVVAHLGGLSIYSWVFSIYILTSTITMPIWGKMSDLYGRGIAYQLSISFFLLGSILSGASTSMTDLIIFRAIQGIGAGGLVPLALTITGELYSLQERGKMQAIFSSVWAVSSLIGPLLGGFLTDTISWRAIFYINIPFGLAAAVIIGFAMPASKKKDEKPSIDVAGAVTLSAAISLLLIACLQESGNFSALRTFGALFLSIVFIVAFIKVEQRSREPLLPLPLFREKLFVAGVLSNLFSGCAVLGSVSFIALFAQGVLGKSATEVGTVFMPLMFGWVLFSVLAGRLLLRWSYKSLAVSGMVLLTSGFALLAFSAAETNITPLYVGVGIVGMGMGLSMFTILMTLQSRLPGRHLGVVTSSILFFRNIGSSLGAGIMGALMNSKLITGLMIAQKETSGTISSDIAKIAANINIAIEPVSRATLSEASLSYFRSSLSLGLHSVFLFSLVIALGAFASVLFLPSGTVVKEKSISDSSVARTAE